jgi:hypothetical protein
MELKASFWTYFLISAAIAGRRIFARPREVGSSIRLRDAVEL